MEQQKQMTAPQMFEYLLKMANRQSVDLSQNMLVIDYQPYNIVEVRKFNLKNFNDCELFTGAYNNGDVTIIDVNEVSRNEA